MHLLRRQYFYSWLSLIGIEMPVFESSSCTTVCYCNRDWRLNWKMLEMFLKFYETFEGLDY